MFGYNGDPDVQFVDVQMQSARQNLTAHAILGYFDAAGPDNTSVHFALACPTPQNNRDAIGLNHDDHIDLPANRIFADVTWPNSDTVGDNCGDHDDDNVGLAHAEELSLPGPACPAATGPTDPHNWDADGDRALEAPSARWARTRRTAACVHRAPRAGSRLTLTMTASSPGGSSVTSTPTRTAMILMGWVHRRQGGGVDEWRLRREFGRSAHAGDRVPHHAGAPDVPRRL